MNNDGTVIGGLIINFGNYATVTVEATSQIKADEVREIILDFRNAANNNSKVVIVIFVLVFYKKTQTMCTDIALDVIKY
ncbi:MAG: hypothetical protein LBD57_04005 [Endomicrobium sp.]|jgi:hypothetical protein|uniref:hypothetical protein n=1 Tax=Candidatus Endomicrobiellum cubanum TaxID=3242325 RepID=UPI002825BAE0|nr:hypothetical protein [Endomicrobium sp.]